MVIKTIYYNIRHFASRYYKRLDANYISKILLSKKHLFNGVNKVFANFSDQFNYAICKSEGKQYQKFPEEFAIPSEFDIIVNPCELMSCVVYIEKQLLNTFSQGYSVIRSVDTNQHIGVILYFHHRELVYFDFQSIANFSLSQELNTSCLDERILSNNGGFYICSSKYELLIRFTEYLKHDYKSWHLDYIKMHKNDFDEDLCNMAISDERIRHEIKKILRELQ